MPKQRPTDATETDSSPETEAPAQLPPHVPDDPPTTAPPPAASITAATGSSPAPQAMLSAPVFRLPAGCREPKPGEQVLYQSSPTNAWPATVVSYDVRPAADGSGDQVVCSLTVHERTGERRVTQTEFSATPTPGTWRFAPPAQL